ncbi:hypothetical protein CRYUN_Cryun03dG0116700 [Craigia yunnanensis]
MVVGGNRIPCLSWISLHRFYLEASSAVELSFDCSHPKRQILLLLGALNTSRTCGCCILTLA